MGGRGNSLAPPPPSAAALYGQGWAQEGLEGWSALETTGRGSNRGRSLPLCLSTSEGPFQPRTGSRARGQQVRQSPGLPDSRPPARAHVLSCHLLEGARGDKGDEARSPVPGGMVSRKERR